MSVVADDRLAAIQAKFDEPLPESWIAKEEGDELVGTFVRLDKASTAHGDCWIVVVESARTPGRFASVWLFHQALINEFARIRPVPGELIGIRYGGKKPVKNQTAGRSNEYHDWKVVVDRAQASAEKPRWDLLAGETTGDFHAPNEAETVAEFEAIAASAVDTDDIPF